MEWMASTPRTMLAYGTKRLLAGFNAAVSGRGRCPLFTGGGMRTCRMGLNAFVEYWLRGIVLPVLPLCFFFLFFLTRRLWLLGGMLFQL